MLLAQIVDASRSMARTASRKGKVEIVADVLREAAEADQVVPVVTDYLTGVLPQRRVGVSWRSLRELPTPAQQATLLVAETDSTLSEMADMVGPGSQGVRRDAVDALFGRATAQEQVWLRGLLTGELRQGAGDGIVVLAIAAASGVAEKVVRRAVMIAGYAAPVAELAMHANGPSEGARALQAMQLQVGRPLRPMLAASAPSVAEALASSKTGSTKAPLAVEAKLDGIRIQAHVDHSQRETVRLFTRTLDEVTDRLPEVVAALGALPLSSAVFDGEVIAQNSQGAPEPFQVTSARTASSADPQRLASQVPLSTYLFDCLHLDGEDLLDVAGQGRWERLTAVAAHLVVPRILTTDEDEAQDFFAQLVDGGHEGVVVKATDRGYAAGRRGAGWVKVKPRHTYDLVVTAIEKGSGRRSQWLSNIHLAARNEHGELVMVGKTFKGMTDEMLAWQTERFNDLATSTDGYVVQVRPEQVVEVATDGVQRSTRYPGGVALRFARVVQYRDDKPLSEISTIEDLRSLL